MFLRLIAVRGLGIGAASASAGASASADWGKLAGNFKLAIALLSSQEAGGREQVKMGII